MKNIFFQNEKNINISDNWKSYNKNVSLLLAISISDGVLAYTLNYDTNNIIYNTNFLIKLHRVCLKRLEIIKKDIIVFLDNSSIQMNLYTIEILSSLPKSNIINKDSKYNMKKDSFPSAKNESNNSSSE